MMAGNQAIMIVIILSILATVLQICSAAPFNLPATQTFTDISSGKRPIYPIKTDKTDTNSWSGSGSGSGSGDTYFDDEDYSKEGSGTGEESTRTPLTIEQLWELFWTITNEHGTIYIN